MAFHNNPQFREFRTHLESAGVSLRWYWETYRAGSKAEARKNKVTYPDVAMCGFIGNGFRPHITTAVVIDYSEGHGSGGGYGFYVDPDELTGDGQRTMLGDAAMVKAGPRAGAIEALRALAIEIDALHLDPLHPLAVQLQNARTFIPALADPIG